MEESVPSVGDKEGGGFDASEIDPVKEFGFLKMGHEFDNFPRHKIRGIKDMDWFLEEQKQDSEDDEENRSKKRKRFGRKKKDNAMEDDDDWTGESEDEKVSISKLRLDKRPKYTKTRSKDKNGKIQDVGSSKNSSRKITVHANDEDEDDETLGGFIVDDEGVDEDEENDDGTNDEEEEEEDDDYNEDDDDE